MATITSAEFWKDTGYTEGCMTVPPTKILSAPNLTFQNLNPTKDRMFSELRVPEDYVTMLDYSYMAVTVDNNNGQDKTFYGWIDSVEMISDSTNAPITQVNWHVDLWRTYFTDAEFGMGMVKRRPYSANMTIPPQNPPYRYQTPTDSTPIYNDSFWWVLVALTSKSSLDQEVTIVEYRAIPVTVSATYGSYNSGPYIDQNVRALSLAKVFDGNWDEAWGIDPENVISVFLSPVPPGAYTGAGSAANPISLSNLWRVAGNDGAGYFVNYQSNYPFDTRTISLGGSYMTSDLTEYHITGFDGETIGTLPWGIPVNAVNMRLVYSATSAYIQLRFKPTSEDANWDYTKSHQYGLCYNVPCSPLDVTSNAWSSYVYSGQRQYDMDQRKMASEANAVSGGLAISGSALTGAASGAMLGSAVPGVGTLVGGIVGAIGGAVTGAVSTGGNFAYETMYKNDAMQDMDDTLHASQANNILLPGNGIDCMFNGKTIAIVTVTLDTYSATQQANNLALYGAKVSEPTVNCTSIINAGGALQIQNLIVTGDIPPMAKDYIKQRFAQGVIIR